MKKGKNESPKKKAAPAKDSGELRKPVKLKPLKEKEKKNWKQNLDDEEEGFQPEDDIKFENDFDDEDGQEYFDDDF